MGLELTQQERDKFASWLELQISNSEAILGSLKALGPAGAIIAQREKQEIEASKVVVNKLRSIEDTSID